MRIQALFRKRWLGYLVEWLKQALSTMHAIGASITCWIDEFFGMTWYYRRLRNARHRMLEDWLRQFGESSMCTPAYVEKWRDADFAVRFGRVAPTELKCFVRVAADEGIPEEDLRLLVLNRDVRLEKGVVLVQCGWGVQSLSWLGCAFFSSNVLFLSLLTLVQHGSWYIKFFTFLILFVIYGFLWRGLSLYTTRPLAAARRTKKRLEHIASTQRSAVILSL